MLLNNDALFLSPGNRGKGSKEGVTTFQSSALTLHTTGRQARQGEEPLTGPFADTVTEQPKAGEGAGDVNYSNIVLLYVGRKFYPNQNILT